MKITHKIIASLSLAGIMGFSAVVPAEAAAHFTPVCYNKTVKEKSGLLGSKTYRNVVVEQRIVTYPPRTKMCYVVQTRDWFKWPDEHEKKVIWQGWITVRY
jgi:hypothetical protein